MPTVASIVERAYRKIGVKAEDEALTADQLMHGVATLDSMLAAWRLHGVDTPLPDLEPYFEFPLEKRFQEGAIYMLASRLAPDYVVPVSFNPDDWFRGIQAEYLRIEEAKMPLSMRRTASQRRIR